MFAAGICDMNCTVIRSVNMTPFLNVIDVSLSNWSRQLKSEQGKKATISHIYQGLILGWLINRAITWIRSWYAIVSSFALCITHCRFVLHRSSNVNVRDPPRRLQHIPMWPNWLVFFSCTVLCAFFFSVLYCYLVYRKSQVCQSRCNSTALIMCQGKKNRSKQQLNGLIWKMAVDRWTPMQLSSYS